VSLASPAEVPLMQQRLRDRRTAGVEHYELRYEHPDGFTRWFRVASSPLFDAGSAYLGSLDMVSDITAVKRGEEELRRQALHDALTELPNRVLLQDRLELALERARRDVGSSVAVLFIDLDQFKLVNDSLGHHTGDDLLREVAARFSVVVRAGDTVARFGGDEFVVLCEQTDADQAVLLAQRLIDALAAPVEIGEQRLFVTASVGVATSPPSDAGEVLQYADAAMYRAKARGRGRVEVFANTLAATARERLALSAELRDALAADQLELHYQPIVDLGAGELRALEALVRWDHPVRGPLPPSLFVAVAEQTGFAAELDRWVLRRACRDVAAMRAAGTVRSDVRVSVNISARHLAEADLETAVRDTTRATGLPPEALGLEITETAVMDDPEAARAIFSRLGELGVTVCLDDFGTGYSSLAYLKRFPVTGLKIDRAFVEHITDSADDLAIVASVVDLARAIGVGAVAEGVETVEQLALLRQLGCASAQGYLLGRPLRRELLAARLGQLAGGRFDVLPPAGLRSPVTRRVARSSAVTAEHGLDRLLELHRDGGSLQVIAATLVAEGFRTPEGTPWTATGAAAVIADRVYPTLWQAG
jgi:diguanylate cyclase (GGDEF)-like protein